MRQQVKKNIYIQKNILQNPLLDKSIYHKTFQWHFIYFETIIIFPLLTQLPVLKDEK